MSAGPSALLRWAPWVLLAAFAAALTFTDIRSLDYWWQLRAGERMVATGEVPRADSWSYTAVGNRWIDMHWSHHVLIYALQHAGGHAAVVAFQGVLVAALLGVVGSIGFRRDRPGWTVAALALLLAVICNRLLPRPELPSMLVLACVLWLFDRHERRGGPVLWAVVPLQLLWANLHGLFAVGLAVCAIHAVAEALRPWAGAPLRPDRLRRMLGVTGLAAGAALLNPNGLDAALFPLTQLGMIAERGGGTAWVVEIERFWQAPLPGLLRAAVILAVAASGLAMLANRRALRLSDPLLWGAFLFLALSAHRNAALFAVVAVPIWVRNVHGALDRRPLAPGLRRGLALAGCALLVAGTLDAARGALFARLGEPRTPGFGVEALFHPDAAVDWLLRERPPGPVFHHMADGGYLLWRAFPDYPVMLDGRLEVYGQETFERLHVAHPERFRAADAEYRFGVVLLNYRHDNYDRLIPWLVTAPEWRLAYLDDVAAVFVRRSPGDRRPDLDLDDPGLWGPLPEAPLRVAYQSAFTRARFDLVVGRHDRGLATWEALMARHPEAEPNPLLEAALLLGAGRRDDAVARLDTLEARYADEAGVLLEAARLRRAVGQSRRAQVLYERAVALDPSLTLRPDGRPSAVADVERRRRLRRVELQGRVESALAVLLGVGLCVVAARARRRAGGVQPVAPGAPRLP